MTAPNQGQPPGSVPFGGMSEFASRGTGDWLMQLMNMIRANATSYINPSAGLQSSANQAGVPGLADSVSGAFGGAGFTGGGGGAGSFWGPILNMFGGSSNTTQGNNFFTNLMGAIGNPAAGMTSDSSLINWGNTPSQGTSNTNNIANRLWGFGDQSGWTLNDASDALLTQNDSVISSSAQIQDLWAAIGASPTASDDFERTASTLGADWDENYGSGNGTWAVDGHTAYMEEFYPYGSIESLCRWIGATGTTSTDDYQTVSIILASKALTGYGFAASDDVIGRADTAAAPAAGNYIRFRVEGDGAWSLSKCIAGSLTTMTSGSITAPGSGSVLTLVCGDKATSTPRHFTVKIGNTTLDSGVFGDTTSNFGASYRGWGFGGAIDSPLFWYPPRVPGKVNTWAARDTA